MTEQEKEPFTVRMELPGRSIYPFVMSICPFIMYQALSLICEQNHTIDVHQHAQSYNSLNKTETVVWIFVFWNLNHSLQPHNLLDKSWCSITKTSAPSADCLRGKMGNPAPATGRVISGVSRETSLRALAAARAWWRAWALNAHKEGNTREISSSYFVEFPKLRHGAGFVKAKLSRFSEFLLLLCSNMPKCWWIKAAVLNYREFERLMVHDKTLF